MKYTFDTSTLIYFIEKLKEKFSLKTEVTEQINELEKIESSETEPTNEMVGIWINTSEDESTNVIARINDDTIASNTTWSSEKINASITSGGSNGGGSNVDLSDYALKTDLHNHNNKSVLDNITSTKVSEWNNKSTFSGNYNDLTNKPTIPTVPTNISSFTNDSGYITSIPSEYITDSELTAKGYATENYVTTAIDNAQLSGGSGETVDMTKYALKTDIPTKTSELTNDSEFITEIPTEYITETELNNKGYLTEHQSLEGYAKTSDLHSHSNKSVLDNITSAKVTEWDNKSTFSGSYNDLTNKPTIPTVTNDLTNTLKSNYDTAYTHSQSTHAPSNAQKNSDITKTEIEAKLTGNITSHTHNQYLTEHQSLENYALKSEIPTNYLTSIPSEYITETELTAKGYLTEHQDISGKADKSDIPTKTSELTNDSGYLTSIPGEYVTDSELTAKGYATEDYVDEAVDNLSELKMNIVNGLTFANAYINYNNGDYVSGGSAYACQEYIPVISDATYEVSGVSNIVRIAYYDSSKTYMNQYVDNTPTFNFTPPSDASYIRVHVDSNSNAWQNLSIESEIEDYIRTYINNATSGGSGNVDLSSYALKTDLHSHSNKTVLDGITSDMTTKWNQSIPFNDTYVSDCNAWLTNGYVKIGANQTSNLPSACTGSDRWGILFFIAENATQGTGTQMYFPIDGTYKGRIFTRSLTNMNQSPNVGEWNLLSTFSGNYNDLTNKPTIPSTEGLATEGYVNNMLSGLRLIQMTQSEYDSLEVKDSNTLYIII